MSKFVKKRLMIDGMHCSSCAMSIDMDLEDLDGVKESRTNYAKQFSDVEFDEEKLGVEDIIKSINKTGYKVKNIL